MKRLCVNFSCPTLPKCQYVDHENLGPTMEPGKTAQYIKLKCTVCGHESNEVVPRVSKKKEVGPRYHEGLGRHFDDSDHERKWAKANGYEAV
jgi:cytochrome c5